MGIGNVPVILMLQPLLAYQTDQQQVWYFCAWVATIAGNLTLLGSAANLIVAQIAIRERQFEYNATSVARFSFLPTLGITAIGVLAMHLPTVSSFELLVCLFVVIVGLLIIFSNHLSHGLTSIFGSRSLDYSSVESVELHTALMVE